MREVFGLRKHETPPTLTWVTYDNENLVELYRFFKCEYQ